MRVSLNEIQVICRKAFEGIGFAHGDCDDAAEMMPGCNSKASTVSVR